MSVIIHSNTLEPQASDTPLMLVETPPFLPHCERWLAAGVKPPALRLWIWITMDSLAPIRRLHTLQNKKRANVTVALRAVCILRDRPSRCRGAVRS
jgi:hypothetical protein